MREPIFRAHRFFPWRPAALLFALLLVVAGAAGAQLTSGSLYGTVTDTAGTPLPGATATLTGQGAPQVTTTDADGVFRFLGLSPGGYQLTVALDAFKTVEYTNVTLAVGKATSLEVSLEPAPAFEGETVLVTSESPALDPRKVTTGTTITGVELEKIPSARDPWVQLQTVPGVLVDRVNIGGNESGQQSNFVGNGVGGGSASWAMDGVVITDPAARGSSPTYFNFDSIEEMAVSTGGSDINALTGGVQLNLVTKRGTNEWRASGRLLVTDEDWQSDSDISNADLGDAGPWNDFNAQPAVVAGNQTRRVEDWGAELGGPVAKDRLWIWGSYSFQDIQALVLSDGPAQSDDTELENYAAKLNGQLTSSNSLVAFYHYGDKRKFGRDAGPTRPPETTFDQSGPTDIWKLEDTHIFSSNLYLTGMVSYVGGGFQLVPKSGVGPEVPDITRDANRVWRNSFIQVETERPQEQAKLDGSYFFTTGEAGHELKFGVGYRFNEVRSLTTYPGGGLLGLANFGNFAAVTGVNPTYLGVFVHDIPAHDELEQWNLFVQDTLSLGNLTANVGLRYDLQTPQNNTIVVPASRAFPQLIPEFTREGGDPGFEWETVNPRLGLTYAVGEERKTLLRASYSRFSDQLTTGFFNFAGVNIYKTGYFWWYESNANQVIDPGEVQPFTVLGDRSQVANIIDPDLSPALTDEVVLGVEHAVLPELVLGLSATLRRNTDLVTNETLVVDGVTGEVRPHQPGDYSQAGTVRGTLPSGEPFDVPVYALNVARDPAQGVFSRNSGQEQEFLGLSFTFNKRLSNRWLLRGFVSWQDWTHDIPGGEVEDPTPLINTVDGSPVLVQSAGSGLKSEVFINSEWSFNVSGLYQVAPDKPWSFNVAADVNGRQGFSIPYRVAVSGQSALTGDTLGRSVVVAPEVDSFRNDDLLVVNARLEKEFQLGDFGLTLGIDAFNLFNEATVLQTESFLAAEGVDLAGNVVATFPSNNGSFARETLAPRIFRIGARLSWN